MGRIESFRELTVRKAREKRSGYCGKNAVNIAFWILDCGIS
jgi:hypothetical protein